jgi:hypothetical protein
MRLVGREQPRLASTVRFYDWEMRGRGWQVWPYSVELEPPFVPFSRHPRVRPVVADDGRKPNQITEAFKSLFGMSRGHDVSTVSDVAAFSEEPEPNPFRPSESAVELRMVLPPDTTVRPPSAQKLLISLRSCSYPIAFELIGTAAKVVLQFVCRTSDARIVRQQLLGHFPDAAILDESTTYLHDQWTAESTAKRLVVDFGLSEEFVRPLQVFTKYDPDPFSSIVASLSDLEDGEIAVVQVLFTHTKAPWADHALRSVSNDEGKSFFEDDPDMLALAYKKLESPLCAAVLRIGVQASASRRLRTISRSVSAGFAQFSALPSNNLIPLSNDDYPDDWHQADLLARQTHRSGMLLNVEELAGFVHPPNNTVYSDKLGRYAQRTRQAPAQGGSRALTLGTNVHRGSKRTVSLPEEVRLRHMHVIGASGTGKSTLLLDLVLQDINQGAGLAVLDPHGDLIDQIIGNVPASRVDDVVVIDPADVDHPVAFNILSAHSELEKTLLSSDLVALFRRFSTSWGDQMTAVLGNAVLAFLESDRGGSLVDLRRFLVEPTFREEFLVSVSDPQVVYFWRHEFELLPGRPQGPILTRLDTFLRPKTIRAMVAQRQSRLDFASIMDEGKIALIKLSHGAIGEENASVLGTLLVAKIHQLAMGRQHQATETRRPFFLYIDEFHNFLTPSLASMLSGARKYGLGLVLAHQELGQLLNADRDIAGAVLTNAATRICFRVGDDDAKRLQKGFSSFSAEDLMNLGRGEAICRIDQSSADFNLTTRVPPLADAAAAVARREQIVTLSGQRYAGRPVEPSPHAMPVVPAEPSKSRVTNSVEAKQIAAAATQRASRADLPALPGRGGPQHKYVQNLVKRWAESRGFFATLELPVLNGLGQIDLVLEKGERRIACEISITTNDGHELENVTKCLTADYSEVVLLTVERRRISGLTAMLNDRLPSDLRQRVRVLTVDDLFQHLDDQPDVAGSEKTVRGYKVRLKQAAQEGELRPRQVLIETILGAIRRLRPRA